MVNDMPNENNNDGDLPSLSQNTKHSPPFLIPTPLSFVLIPDREGRVAAALKVSKAFVGSLSLDDDYSVPPGIDVPSTRSKLEQHPLLVW
jgi:hypothetical protein